MWNGVFHPDVTRRETGSGNTGAGSTTEGSELPCSKSFGERCALQASLEGVLSPNDFEQPPSKGRSVVGMVRRLLRRCPLSLDEGYHRSDVGLVERLLVAGAEILYLDCAGGHFRFSADGQESDVLAVGVVELLFEF